MLNWIESQSFPLLFHEKISLNAYWEYSGMILIHICLFSFTQSKTLNKLINHNYIDLQAVFAFIVQIIIILPDGANSMSLQKILVNFPKKMQNFERKGAVIFCTRTFWLALLCNRTFSLSNLFEIISHRPRFSHWMQNNIFFLSWTNINLVDEN